MRVLALVTDAFGGHGGIAEYNQHFLTALANSGGVTEVIALPRFGTPSAPLPGKIAQLPNSPSRSKWLARAVQESFRYRPNLIFCGHINAAPLAAAVGKAISAPVWLQVHGIEVWSERGRLVRRGAEASSLITSVSRYTRRQLLSWCNVLPERVRVLPNTLSDIHRTRPKRENFVARHRLEGRKVILTVGRMAQSERYKGHDRIIRCLARLRHFMPIYLVVGSGDDRPRLERLAHEVGVADLVTFVGQVPADDLPDYYALADVFAMPSTGEGFGIVFLEAAAYGLPVIGGNRDGSVDALADGAIGRPVDPEDEDALVAALVDALKGAQRGSSASVKRFAFENFAHHVDDLVRSLAR
jgi:phosphatidylinositol alpha-1,6-mannosyltransferase